MITRDPEAKRRQLLDAALTEFAAAGFAATKTDQIARRAGCSTGLIYTYFGSKEGLFDAVFAQIVEDVVADVPITPEDLPGYAAQLFDGNTRHPEIVRFVAWQRLERTSFTQGSPAPPSAGALQHKVEAVRVAQQQGKLSTRFDAGQLVFLVQAIATSWAFLPEEVAGVVAAPDDIARRRLTVIEAVKALIA